MRVFGRLLRGGGPSSGDDADRPRRRSIRWRWLLVGTLSVLSGALAGVTALALTPATFGEVGPGTISVKARWDVDSGTRLLVPPFGSLSADTHTSPVAFEAEVERIDLVALERLIDADDPREALYDVATADLGGVMRRFAIRSLLAATAAGALAGVVLFRHQWRHVVAGGLSGVVAVAALFGATWRGYDVRAFEEPRYQGLVARAPEIIETAQRHVEGFDDVRRQVEVVARQISDLYALSTSGPPAGDEDETVILHVSDVHLNPVGLELTRELASSFRVDAVLDTGDLTSFGNPLESRVVEAVADIPVPYLFVPGNHDSDENRQAVADLPNVTLLDGEPTQVGGVTILGVADPTFTASNEIASDEAAEIRLEDARRVTGMVFDERPDVLAVHDIRLGEASAGLVPLVVTGHLHKRMGRHLEGDTLWLSVGSTGATGIGSFAVAGGLPYEAQILRFRGRCLSELDYVTLDGVGGSFDIERRAFDLETDENSIVPRCIEREDDDPDPTTTTGLLEQVFGP